MAPDEDERPVDHQAIIICHRWALEFDTKFVWEKILENHYFDNDVLEFINGLARRITLSGLTEHRSCIRKETSFLRVLVGLADLQCRNSSTDSDFVSSVWNGDSEEGSDSAAIQMQETLIEALDTLCDICSTDNIKLMLPEVRQQSLLQCLYSWCRQGKYKDAEQCYKKCSTEFDKETQRKAEAVLHAKKKPHRFLESETFQNFVVKMVEFLKEVRKTFDDPPFLLQLAQDFSTLPKKYQNRKVKLCPNKHVTNEDVGALEDKLTEIREKVRKQVAAKARGTPRKSSSPDKTVSPRTGSPRKRGTPSRTHSASKRKLDFESDSDDEGRGSRSPKKKSSKPTENGNQDEHSDSSSGSEDEVHSQDSDDSGRQKGSPSKQHNLTSVRVRRSLAPRPTVKHKLKSTQRHKWTTQEEEEFYQLVQQYGVGAWVEIRQAWKTSRTNVMLKDKWRNIWKSSYDKLCDKFGPVEGVEVDN
ncbi:hypothetical protein BaRGS_00007918 [Batillaria attramentaria]|uniref:Uncharacterized protein n=1 Tax=Batillaria attramentaria TaxID=370345 RepID=A0ABD0LM55_9CAEN